MLSGIFGGLILAWILSWFGVDYMALEFIDEMCGTDAQPVIFYIIFAVIGCLVGLGVR
jgi:hypothetical protein